VPAWTQSTYEVTAGNSRVGAAARSCLDADRSSAFCVPDLLRLPLVRTPAAPVRRQRLSARSWGSTGRARICGCGPPKLPRTSNLGRQYRSCGAYTPQNCLHRNSNLTPLGPCCYCHHDGIQGCAGDAAARHRPHRRVLTPCARHSLAALSRDVLQRHEA
jgi:hypothetical protein